MRNGAKSRFIRFACALSACVPLVSHSFTIAENGKLRSDIVIPAKPLDCERYAADELKHHIDKAFGVSATILREDALAQSEMPFHFYLGATEAAKTAGVPAKPLLSDEHVVKTAGDGLFLVGRDAPVQYDNIYRKLDVTTPYATVYAVYDFLENEMGVKWIWPGPTGEVVPERKSLSVGDIDRRFREPLEDRFLWGMHAAGTPGLGFTSKESRQAFFDAQGRFLARHRVGRRHKYASGHSFNDWWNRFGKDHPEYFNMLPDGTRRPASSPKCVTMCVSEPGVWRQKIEDWKKWWKEYGAPRGFVKWVNCCENDYMALCRCPRCRAWDAPDPRFDESPWWNGVWTGDDIRRFANNGNYWMLSLMTDHRWGIMREDTSKRPVASVSDRYAKFYNAVQAEARKADPEARVIGYAYENYLEGPKETKLDPSVVIEFVPRSYFPYDKGESEFFRKTWSGWRKAGAKDLILRPNYTLSGMGYPFDQGRIFLDDLAFAYTNGMKSCTFDSLTGSWSCHAVMMYSLLRAFREPLRDPDLSYADVLSAFGPAKNAVRRYFDAIRANNARWTYDSVRRIAWENPMGNHNGGGSFPTPQAIVGEFFDDSFFRTAAAALSDAAEAAKGDAEILARIDYLRKGLKSAYLVRKTRLAQKASSLSPRDESKKAAFLAALEELKAHRAATENDFIACFDREARAEKTIGWPHKPAY